MEGKKGFLFFTLLLLALAFLVFFFLHTKRPILDHPVLQTMSAGKGKPLLPLPGTTCTEKMDVPQEKGLTTTPKRRKIFFPGLQEKKSLFIRVFSHKEGKRIPSPYAKVFFLDGKDVGNTLLVELNAQLGDYRFAEIEKTRLCREYTTDSSGKVVIILPWHGMRGDERCRAWIMAESSDGKASSLLYELQQTRNGNLRITFPGREKDIHKYLELLLQTAVDLQVLVQDTSGKPVEGVPVGLFYTLFGPTNERTLLRKATTGPGGIAFFHRIHRILKVFSYGRVRLFTSFLFPCKDLNKYSYFLEAPNGEFKPVRMTLPQTGSLAVRVKNVPQKERKFQGWIALFDSSRFALDSRINYSWPDRSFYLFSFSKPMEPGNPIVTFPFVGIGLKVTIIGIRKGFLSLVKKEIQGPSVPGEKVATTLAFPVSDPTLSLELVDGEGKKLKSMEVEIWLPYRKRDLRRFPLYAKYWRTLVSDEKGRLLISLPPPFVQGNLKQIELVLPRGAAGKTKINQVLDLPPPFSRGIKKMGRIVLAVPPLLLSGKVLDFQGKPCEGAWVTLLRERIEKNGEKNWASVNGCSTGPGGVFTVRGNWPWKTMWAMAAKAGQGCSPPIMVSLGTRDVIFHLSGSGGMEATLRLDDPAFLRFRMVRVIVDLEKEVSHGDYVRYYYSTYFKVTNTGVHFFNLKPGFYKLKVIANGQPKNPLYQVSGILVNPGETNRDPRIQDIDLRGKLDRAVVTVLDEKGRPLDSARTSIPSLYIYGSKGRLRLAFLKGTSVTLILSAPGYKKKKITVEKGSYTVRMEKSK